MIKFIAEIGINHNGKIDEAKKLIDLAKYHNVWGIKFQYRNLDNYFSKNSCSSELGKEIIDNEIKKNYLSPKNIIQLSNFAKKNNLKVGISFFSKRDFVDFRNYNFDFYKVPSPVSDNFKLIKFLKNKSDLLFISFGGRNLHEIKKIISTCNLKAHRTILMHCISNYPVAEKNANLGFIDTLKKNFNNFNIGYSSHESSIINSILCLAKKINYLERHVTLDKTNKGLDHSSSSDFQEIKVFQKYNKDFDLIFFKQRKFNPNQGEIINIQNLGTSYYFKENLKVGTYLKPKYITLRHPNVGITDLTLNKFIKKKIIHAVKKNEPLVESNFYNVKLSKKNLNKLNALKISLPVRPRDYEKILNEIYLQNFEMHLSFKDIKRFNKKSFKKKFLQNKNFSIHMPDYCDENNIIDFFSKKKNINERSNDLLKKTIYIAKYIRSLNNSYPNIVVSLSNILREHDKFDYYKKIKKLSDYIKKKHKINLLPQWLPVNAWYFGGSMQTGAFSNPTDLNYLKKIDLKICLDISHYILSCNYYKIKKIDYFKKNLSIFNQYHLSDAKNDDGEGVMLGKGEIIKSGLLDLIFKETNKVKVLETWQGHLNNCHKFKYDCKKIISLIK